MPTACVLYAGSEFAESGRAVQQYLKGRNYTVTLQDITDEATFDRINTPPGGCDVSVWLSHGGWDGPLIWEDPNAGGGWHQIDPVETPGDWKKLKQFMTKFMKPNGLVVTHACHSAGSNKWESKEGPLGERWAQQLARDMNLYTTGVLGSTASANYKWAVEFVRYSLDGGRYAYQAAHAYAPGGKRDMQWKGWTGR